MVVQSEEGEYLDEGFYCPNGQVYNPCDGLCSEYIFCDPCYPTPTASKTPTPTPQPSMTPTITPTNTPSITPTISLTPSITPTISLTPTITPTISLTPTITPTNYVDPIINGGHLYLSGLTTGVAFKLNENSLVSNNGILYEGFNGLYSVGDLLNGNLYITQYFKGTSTNNYNDNNLNTLRPLLVDGNLIALPTETYKVITYNDFINNGFVKWSYKASSQTVNTYDSWTPKLSNPPVYRYPLSDEKITYNFNVVSEPITDDIVPYNGNVGFKVYVEDTLLPNNNTIVLLLEEVIQSYQDTNFGGSFTYDIEYLPSNDDIISVNNVFELNNLFYSLGGFTFLGEIVGAIGNSLNCFWA